MKIENQDISQVTQDLYTIPNPKYLDLIKIGRDTRWCSKTLKIFYEGLFLPGAAFWSAQNGKKLFNGLLKKESLKYNIEWRPGQEIIATEMEKYRCCLLEANTGFGKTVVSSYLTAKLGLKTLIVCHSVIMVKQFEKEYKKFLDIDVGVWYGQKKELKDITVTTYQSVVQQKQMFHDYGFEMLIVDEADLFTTANYLEFLCKTTAQRIFGFTATPKIEKYDNLLEFPFFMQRVWGKIIKAKVDNQTDILKEINIHHHKKTYYDEGIFVPTKEWHLFRKLLDEDNERKGLQCEWILENIEEDDHSLILLDRVLDVEQYFEKMSKFTTKPLYYIHGSVPKKQREETIKAFKEKGGTIIANYKILGRGFDADKASKIFICFPLKSETSVRQALGRIIRFLPDKQAKVYDWIDSSLSGQFKARRRVYEEFFPNAIIK